jgi:tetratricopeptide (TPR) repeat protein
MMTARTSETMIKTIWPYLLIGLVVILAYLPSFSGEFILDDKALIEYNSYIKQLHSLKSYLYQEDGIIEKEKENSYHTGYYRPLINLSYWIDYKLWGMKASCFRVTNVIFHILCSFLFYRFLRTFENNRIVALVVALLFALHPVNTESVSWITSRNNIIVTIFSLLSFLLYRKAHETTSEWPLVVSIICFAFALFSKEFGVMLFPIFVLYREMIGKNKHDDHNKSRLTWYLPFALVLLFYFILRQNATHSWLSPEGTERFFRSVFFAPYLFLINIKLLLAPYNLHSFVVKYPNSYMDPFAWIGIAFGLFYVAFLWKMRRNTVLTFSMFSFLIALFPIMNIISTSSMSLISMRWLYFPMVFLGPLACIAIMNVIRVNKMLTVLGLSLIVSYFWGYTYVLNYGLWKSEDTFFPKEINQFGNSYYAYGYALHHLERKNFGDAEKYLKIAINGYHHKKAAVYLTYSEFLIQQGRFEDVIALLKKDGMFPLKKREHAWWCSHLGTAYFNLGKKKEAIGYYQKAVTLLPAESEFWANLGGAYGSIRAYSKSSNVLQRGLSLHPESALIRKNLAHTYIRLQRYREALNLLDEISSDRIKNDKKLIYLYYKAKNGLEKEK